MIRGTRGALGALAVLAAILLGSAPAGAHAPGPQLPDASYYRTELAGGVTPAMAGVTARVDPGGEWVELANSGPATVLVLGYTGEPYLRLTATGAEENQLSQTTYLNRALFADSVPTAGAGGSSVAPAWKQLGGTGIARWHDHRIHWMGRDRPPAVAADPTHPHLVGDWTVHATADGTPFEVHGVLRWLGKPADAGRATPAQAWLLTLLAGMTVVVGVLIVALIRARRRPPAVGVAANGGSVTGPARSQASAGPGSSGS
ncbi:hypothetical protein HC028_24710 [Planosporangium flavigriseum]|uniref:Uncharacterized protein n=1 Tax=Planosporangium flavigriseum TaxID=373681 RepID=A0A8J3PNY8_9ACTN|nr:hypothetical protein [Planosporangium flavigriseum]NJC67681.1 hypothetical protein [Planosporangium flavigriseum]GIG75844.1 hypothetical protein Pfl04_42480 [Planosporangium flavigriseum]